MDGLRWATGGLLLLLGGMLGGMALGNFAAGDPRLGGDPLLLGAQVGNPHAAYGDASGYDAGYGDARQFEPVICKGCGPGIEERSRGFAFGYDDKAVRTYLADSPMPPLTMESLGESPGERPAQAARTDGEHATSAIQPAVAAAAPPDMIASGQTRPIAAPAIPAVIPAAGGDAL